MLDNPSLLQELPDIAALLPQGGGDREQAAAADRILAGLDAVTELALNHRLAQSTFCGVVGGLDRLDLQPSRYGPLLSALVGLLRSAFPLSFSKTQALLQLLVGVEMQGPLVVCPSSAGAPLPAPVWCAGLAPVRWPRRSRTLLLQAI